MASLSVHVFEAETWLLPHQWWRLRMTVQYRDEDQFARATRQTVAPNGKAFGFMLDGGVRLYHRSWAAVIR